MRTKMLGISENADSSHVLAGHYLLKVSSINIRQSKLFTKSHLKPVNCWVEQLIARHSCLSLALFSLSGKATKIFYLRNWFLDFFLLLLLLIAILFRCWLRLPHPFHFSWVKRCNVPEWQNSDQGMKKAFVWWNSWFLEYFIFSARCFMFPCKEKFK